jgi:hypothetical protein
MSVIASRKGNSPGSSKSLSEGSTEYYKSRARVYLLNIKFQVFIQFVVTFVKQKPEGIETLGIIRYSQQF